MYVLGPSNKDYKSHKKPKGYDPSKIVECLVCGKKFPRGIIDLARHQTAITLQHLVSLEKTATCYIPCEKCGVYFSTEEHVRMHLVQSSCGFAGEMSVEEVKQQLPIKHPDIANEGMDFIATSDQDTPAKVEGNQVIEIPASEQLKPQAAQSDHRALKKGKVVYPTGLSNKIISSLEIAT